MNSKNDDNVFYEYLDQLQELFQKNPARATEEARIGLNRLSSKKAKVKLINEEDKPTLFIVIYFIILALLGLFSLSTYPMHIFGLIFFASGIMIGLKVHSFGIIFLFSHGMTGFCLMIGMLLAPIISSPVMSDMPIFLYCSFGVIILLTIIAIILTILYNLSNVLKKKPYFEMIPLILFGIVFIIALLVSKYFLAKYGITAESFLDLYR